MKKILKILSIIIIISSALIYSEEIDILHTKIYKIGLPDVPGLMFRDNNGTPKGLPLEVLVEALKQEGINYEFVDGSWHDLYYKAVSGEIDLLPGTIISDERQLNFDFCKENLYLIWSEIFIRKDADYYHLTDFNGKKIGLVRDDYHGIGFERYIDDFHIEYEKVYFNSHTEAAEALRKGEIFGMAGPNPNILNSILIDFKRSGLYFNPNYMTYAFPKGKNSELREYLDKKLIEYKADKNSLYYFLLNEYRISHISPNEPFMPQWLIYSIVILSIAITLFSIFTYILKRQVIAKTKALIDQQQTLRNAFKMGKMGFWELDLNENILFRSHEMLKLLNLPDNKQYFTLSEMESSIHIDDVKLANAYVAEIINSNDLVEKELRMIGLHGNIVYTNQIGYSLNDESGNKVKIVGITQDITERKIYETELIAAKEKAEESEKLKSAFLANMSHEIRTPLNAVVGFSSLIAKEDLDDDEKEKFVEIVLKQKDLLLNLINDIIDFSKIESGTIDINIKKYNNVKEIVDEVYNVFKDKAKNKLVIKRNHYTTNKHCTVEVDINRIKQILTNFLTNALKFTVEGEIEIGCRINEDTGKIELFVKDTGIGIDKSMQSKIFERFTQVDSFSQGTGLGLSISKYLAEKMNCEIKVLSELGLGSEFILEITPSKDEIEIE